MPIISKIRQGHGQPQFGKTKKNHHLGGGFPLFIVYGLKWHLGVTRLEEWTISREGQTKGQNSWNKAQLRGEIGEILFLTKVDVGGVGGCQIGFSCLAFGPAHSGEKKKVDKSFSYSQVICWGASNQRCQVHPWREYQKKHIHSALTSKRPMDWEKGTWGERNTGIKGKRKT